MIRFSTLVLLGVAALLAIAGPAQAGLIGSMIDIDFADGFTASAQVTVVSPGVEVGCTDTTDVTTCSPSVFFGGSGLLPEEFIDIDDFSITLNLAAGFPPPQTISFSSLDFGGPSLTGISFGFNSIAWLSQGDLSFTGDSLTIDLGDTSDPSTGGRAQLLLETSAQPAPEPSTLLLLSGGLLALGLRRRRRL